MASFPGSPRILKGALVEMNPLVPVPNVIVFQYNPDTLTRRLEARATGGGEGSDRGEAFRLSGPPKENLTLSVTMDAADQLERSDPLAAASGLGASISALELMLYPKSQTIIANTALAQVGFLEVVPPEAPLTIFVWGPQRVVPVRLTSFSVSEEAYDTKLNPIRAKAELGLQVLSSADLRATHPGHSMYVAHQISKEILGKSNVVNGASAVGSSLKFF